MNSPPSEHHAFAGNDSRHRHARGDHRSRLARGIAKIKRHHAHAALHVAPHAGHSAEASRRVMKADAGGSRIERARVGPDHALAEVRGLQALVAQVALDELGHRPVEEHVLRFVVVAEARLDLLARGRLADPQIAVARWTQRVAQSAKHVAHRAPAFHVARREPANFRLALRVIVPKLHARAVEEGNEEPVDRGRPRKAALGQIQLGDNERMQKPREIRARRHAHAGEGLLDRAGAAHAAAALEHQHALARARQIRRARQAVVPRAHNHHIPAPRGQFVDGSRQTNLAKDSSGRRVHGRVVSPAGRS